MYFFKERPFDVCTQHTTVFIEVVFKRMNVTSPDALAAFCRHASALVGPDGVLEVCVDESRLCIQCATVCGSVSARYEGTGHADAPLGDIGFVTAGFLSAAMASFKSGNHLSVRILNDALCMTCTDTASHTTTEWAIPLQMALESTKTHALDAYTSLPRATTFQCDIRAISHMVSNSDRVSFKSCALNGPVVFRVPRHHAYNAGGVGASTRVAPASTGAAFHVTLKWKFLSKAAALLGTASTPLFGVTQVGDAVVASATQAHQWRTLVVVRTLDPESEAL